MVEVRPVSKPKVAASKSFFRENPRGDSQKKILKQCWSMQWLARFQAFSGHTGQKPLVFVWLLFHGHTKEE